MSTTGLSYDPTKRKLQFKQNLSKFFDKEGNGTVNVDQFMYSLRGRPNEERQAAIDSVFKKFDKNSEGKICTKVLKSVFNCVDHPRYIQGDLTEDQVFFLFLQNFPKNQEGTIDRRGWNDYYAGVSVTVDDDRHFISFIYDEFKL